uniref:Uncharacterized protein n=1 Tax=Cacopsylla melanoneura TaxID=428564 RepID=A0A8D8VU08_9HEMI
MYSIYLIHFCLGCLWEYSTCLKPGRSRCHKIFKIFDCIFFSIGAIYLFLQLPEKKSITLLTQILKSEQRDDAPSLELRCYFTQEFKLSYWPSLCKKSLLKCLRTITEPLDLGGIIFSNEIMEKRRKTK